MRTLETARRAGNTSIDDGRLIVTDANGVVRFEAGNLDANGASPAQYGPRTNRADGSPIADALGIINPLSILGSALNFSQASVTGTGAYQTVSGSSVSINPSRASSLLVLASELLVDPTVGDTGFVLSSAVLVDGVQSASNGPECFNLSGAGTTMTPFAVLSGVVGSHTLALGVKQTSGKLWTVANGYLYVLLLGG